MKECKMQHQSPRQLFEGFEVGDLKDVLEDWLHIDQFKSKMGRDDKNIVVSFGVYDKNAAGDLVDFLERGYEFVLDADVSTSEVSTGKYLVFVEFLRRRRFYDQLIKVISDLRSASGIKPAKWTFRYMKDTVTHPLTADAVEQVVPLSPKEYRKRFEKPIDAMKMNAGLDIGTKGPFEDPEISNLMSLSGQR
jgi:hypothetical protein